MGQSAGRTTRGPQGVAGAVGPTGSQGQHAYNTTPTFRQNNFTLVSVLSGAYQGWQQLGQAVFIQTGGYYIVTGISGNNLVLSNLASNLPSGTMVNASKMSPAGQAPLIPGSVLIWSADNILATTVTRYLYAGYSTANAATTDIYRIRVPRIGTLRNLQVMQNTVSSSSNASVYTVLVNGVATALTVSVAGNVSTGSDTAHSVAVNAGDQISIRVTKATSVSPAVQQVTTSLEFS